MAKDQKVFTAEEALDIISETKAVMVLLSPFLGSLSLGPRTGLTTGKGDPIACTDGKYIHFHKDRFSRFDLATRVFIIAHEVLHPALGHNFRRGDRHPLLWNYACDYAINALLMEFIKKGIKMTPSPGFLYDPKLNNMDSEDIYAMLTVEMKDHMNQLNQAVQKQQQSGGTGMGADSDSTSDGDGEGDGEESEGAGKPGNKPGQKGNKKGNNSKTSEGEGEDGEEGSCSFDHLVKKLKKGILPERDIEFSDDSEDNEVEEQRWKGLVLTAAEQQRSSREGIGNMPGGLQELIRNIQKPKVPWSSIMAKLMPELVRDDYNPLVYDRRFIGDGLYFEDLIQEKVSFIFAFDTSGSISTEMLEQAFSETWYVLQSRQVTKVRLIQFDCTIQSDEELLEKHDVSFEAVGRGGTDFRPVFTLLEEAPRVTALFVFTDLEGPFPEEEPPYPVFWVIPGYLIREGKEQADFQKMVPFGTILPYYEG